MRVKLLQSNANRRPTACALLWLRAAAALLCLSDCSQAAEPASDPAPGLAGTTVLVMRHAEKPQVGPGLSEPGERHAAAYVPYFKNFKAGSEALALDYLVAAADSPASRRSRLTLEPLSADLGLKPDMSFKATQFAALAESLKDYSHGKGILICWHHHEIPDLLMALGADPEKLLPKGHWPDEEFGWIIELRYDDRGKLRKVKRITPKLGKYER